MTYIPNPAFDSSSQAIRSSEVDPITQNRLSPMLINEANITDGTYYRYVDMDTFKKSGFQLILNGGSGTVTITIGGTMQDDGTAPGSCTYDDVTNAVFGSSSFTASDTLIDDGEALAVFKYIQVTIVASTGGANDADCTIYHKRIY